MNRDDLFSKNMKINDFSFDEKVADVFDDMLERSVPFYNEVQDTAVNISSVSDAKFMYFAGILHRRFCSKRAANS